MPTPTGNKVSILESTVARLKGIGPAKANLLAEELSIHSLRDLLHAYPFRYVDRTKFHRIIDIIPSSCPGCDGHLWSGQILKLQATSITNIGGAQGG